MMKSNLLKRNCLEHKDKQVLLACHNQFCNEKRLVCQSCLNVHSAHTQDLINDDQITEQVQLSQQNVKQFIKQMNEKFDNITLLFRKLISSIETKFYISINKMNVLDNSQLNQYLNQLIIQDQQQQNLNLMFTDGCKYFEDKIVQSQNELNIKELNYIAITNEDKEKAEVYYNQGYDYYDKYDFVNAVKSFDQALDLNKNHLYSLHIKGDSLRMMNQYQESIEWYDKALQIDPQYKLALQGKGESLKLMGQYQESIEWYDKALQIDPQYKLAAFSKGDSLRLMGQYQESIEWFDKALQIDPQYKFALYAKGDSLKMMNQFKESIEWFDKALQIDPQYKFTLLGKGDSLRLLQQYNQALECLDSALKIDNNYTYALGSKGACLINMNKLDEAEICLNKAIKLDPNYSFCKNKLKILQDKRKK